jgi:hypothetical protein
MLKKVKNISLRLFVCFTKTPPGKYSWYYNNLISEIVKLILGHCSDITLKYYNGNKSFICKSYAVF